MSELSRCSNNARIAELEAELADLRRRSIEIWEICGHADSNDGRFEQRNCRYCDRSGKRLKDGVIPVVRSERRDRWYQSFTGHASGYVIPAEMVEGTG